MIEAETGRLAGKVALVTGAAQGIGRTYAVAMAREGARVCVSDVLAPDETVAAVRAIGGEAVGFRADVTDQASVDSMVAGAISSFGRIDVLVNNAALFASLKMNAFQDLDPAEWDRVMAVNVRGTWHATKAVVPAMKAAGGGSIINIASATVFKGSPFLAHYVASKGAVIALTRALAREVAEHGIRINALAPGLVMSAGVQDHPGWIEASKAIVASRAIKRDSTPEDMVGAVLYLASGDSAFVTGQTLVVDGGSVMH